MLQNQNQGLQNCLDMGRATMMGKTKELLSAYQVDCLKGSKQNLFATRGC